MFNDEQINNLIERYYFDGFVFISNYQKELAKYLDFINDINKDLDLFEKKKKNVTTFTLKQDLLPKSSLLYFNSLIKDIGILDLAERISFRSLYLTNFIHFLSFGNMSSLPWHRDTYRTLGKTCGTIPAPTKIAIYSSKVKTNGAPMEIVPGSHRMDFQNRFFDKIQPYFYLKKYVVKANPGDLLIFDASLLHRRASCKNNNYRSATIFGLNALRK